MFSSDFVEILQHCEEVEVSNVDIGYEIGNFDPEEIVEMPQSCAVRRLSQRRGSINWGGVDGPKLKLKYFNRFVPEDRSNIGSWCDLSCIEELHEQSPMFSFEEFSALTNIKKLTAELYFGWPQKMMTTFPSHKLDNFKAVVELLENGLMISEILDLNLTEKSKTTHLEWTHCANYTDPALTFDIELDGMDKIANAPSEVITIRKKEDTDAQNTVNESDQFIIVDYSVSVKNVYDPDIAHPSVRAR